MEEYKQLKPEQQGMIYGAALMLLNIIKATADATNKKQDDKPKEAVNKGAAV